MAVKVCKDCFEGLWGAGAARCNQSVKACIILGFFAGAYIAFGGVLALRAAGAMPLEFWGSFQKFVFGGVFPVGLMLVVIGGADLFTGNCMTVTGALLDKRITVLQLLRSWIYSWFFNLVGSLFVAFCLGYLTGLFFESVIAKTATGADALRYPWAEFTVKLANAKCALPWMDAFWRAIGCNWLVCLAVFMAFSTDEAIGKIFGIWFPIMAFVAIGFEHSVANMAFIPLGLFNGTDPRYLASVEALGAAKLTASWMSMFVNNLIPVTIGNIVGGGIFVAGLYFTNFGATKKEAA